MRRQANSTLPTQLVQTACLVALCGLLGYWFSSTRPTSAATDSALRVTSVTPTFTSNQTDEPPAQPSDNKCSPLNLQVQEMLAQGGCPGWISLASEPELLQRLPAVESAKPEQAKLRQADHHSQTDNRPNIQLVQATNEVESLLTDADDLLGNDDDLLSNDSLPQPAALPEQLPMPSSDVAELLNERDDLLSDDPQPAGVLQPGPQLRPRIEQLPTPQPAGLPTNNVPGSALPELLPELLNDQDSLLAPEPVATPSPSLAPPVTPLPVTPQATAPVAAPRSPSLFSAPPKSLVNPHANASAASTAKPKTHQEHCQFVADSLYPSAESCRTCHEKLYEEWSVSSHAYAAVSPMFQKFEQTIHNLSQGTIGYFCYRCHSPVGTALGYDRTTPLWEMPQVAREGVTCVACHRVNEMYSKTNGERRIVPGDIHAPVYGSIGGHGIATAIANKSKYKVKTSPGDKSPGQAIHNQGVFFPQLSKSEFCTSCHQVAVDPGIKLEVVWEQYRASPACKKGVSCQDCHMGRIPGVASGYEFGPAAVVNKKHVHPNRKHANHTFYGPGYSIAHPGIFPWNPKSKRWNMQEWLLFDWRGGWGTQDFEDAVDDGLVQVAFPKVWDDVDDRMDAREIIEANQKKLTEKDHLRRAVLENGSHVDGPYFKHPPRVGRDFRFSYTMVNTNDGHNLPTASLGAQPQMWANVVLIGPRGNRIWETGYLDRFGDLADIHSAEVRHKQLAFDWQLFNLQSMFLITGVKGPDREVPLPVNVSIDQLPYLRPGAQPISAINHPPFIRMESRSLSPLGSRKIPYRIPGKLLREPGTYRLSFRMRSRAEPIYFMRFCNTTPEMQQAMTEKIMDFHPNSFEFTIE